MEPALTRARAKWGLDLPIWRGIIRRATDAAGAATQAWRALRARVVMLSRRRSLIGEILALQLAFAAVIGVLALTSLWVASSWIIEDNMRKWGEQWLSNLDELGMPLYVSEDDEAYLRVENYVNKFGEISFVRYYSASGEPVFTDFQRPELSVLPLDPEILQSLADSPEEDRRYVVDTLFREMPLVRISKPIWTQSLLADGLLGLDFDDANTVKESLVGYVELGLDFSSYQAQLTRNILLGALIGGGVLIMLTAASWFTYRRALLPLSQLQRPLKDLARGKTNFSFSTSGHKEIVAIADALNTTVGALNERDKRLWHLANHDPLTGLINRHRFTELLDGELENVAGRGKTSALLFIDLDQFKYVNDMYGHAAGDRLLKHVADQLRDSVRKQDVVARFGGDEFIILISDVGKKEVGSICEALVRMREHRILESGDAFSIRCSIGVTMIRDNHFTPDELLAQADMACHDAKTRGRNQFQFYKASSKEINEMAADIGWSQQIEKALKDESFVLHYQPIIDIGSGKPAYYEVLLRMQSEPRKLIPPTAFLPAANRFGLMGEIDQWVIRNSLQSLATLRAKHGDIKFTLNISGSTFETTDLFKYISEHLETNKVPLDAIVLEITEQVAVRNIGSAAKQISYLADRGCKFAIDDFGAGYSSYKYLKSLSADFVKIDGSFIGNLADDFIDQRIVGSICEIAQATNSKTIAEHVKDYATFAMLRDLGVDYAQGYFLGRPSAKLKSEPLPIALDAERRKPRVARA